MLYVDRRVGSAELYLPLQARRLPVELTTLDFGDLALVGHGPGGHSLLIGIERKRITDLVQSMTSGRLSGHQLPGLVEMYAHRWLLVEGAYREADNGLLEIPTGRGRWETTRLMHSAVEAYLLTLTLRGGMHVHRTFDTKASITWIAALYHWWTAKTWAEHRSHLATHQPADPGIWSRPTLVHRMASQLPGIGDEKAAAVAKHFRTVTEMVEATEAAWRQIPGIGKTLAAGAVKALRGS
jgi:ERCC4-type nuclease